MSKTPQQYVAQPTIEGQRRPFSGDLLFDGTDHEGQSAVSLTQQHFAAECDIGNIVAHYQNTGIYPHTVTGEPNYGDLSNLPDYQSAMNTIIAAQQAFDALPSHLRENFQNDPAKFMAFVHDDKNYTKAQELGILDPEAVARALGGTVEKPSTSATQVPPLDVVQKPAEQKKGD